VGRRFPFVLVLALALFVHGPSRGQDPVQSLGEQRLADARMFLSEGEWDATMAVVEEVAWYFPEGDPHLGEANTLRRTAQFGKAAEQGDAAGARGDHAGAVSAYERALGYREDAGTRGKLEDARARLAPPEPTTPAEVIEDPGGQEDDSADDEPITEDPVVEDTTEGTDEPLVEDAPELVVEDAPEDPAEAIVVESVETTPSPTEGDAVASVDPVVTEADGTPADKGGGLPWFWMIAAVCLLGLGVAGTRTPVLISAAGAMRSMGYSGGARSVYQLLQRRGVHDPELTRAHAECLASLGEIDDEARQIYKGVLEDDASPELVAQLAALYWANQLTSDEAPWIYQAALVYQPEDPELWEAREACLGPEDQVERLDLAQKLIAAGRPSPGRLLRVAEQFGDGEPTAAQREIIAELTAASFDDTGTEGRRVALIARTLPIYQEHDLVGEDAITLREAYLLTMDAEPLPRSTACRMAGPRASSARVVLAELARLLVEAGRPASMLDVYLRLIERFRGEPLLLDGMLQTASDISAYDRALVAIEEFYPLDARQVDPAAAMLVSLALMVAGSRNLRERERDTGMLSSDYPGLTFFSLARSYMGLIDVEETYRPDVREQVARFIDLYRRNQRHLSGLDGELANLLWRVGDFPGAVSTFFWSCGFETHGSDKDLMLLPGDEIPPGEEHFPDDHSTLVVVVADREVETGDLDALGARMLSGAMNRRVGFLVSGRPFTQDVRRHAADGTLPPIVLARWSDLARALGDGQARPALRRMVRNRLRFSLPPIERSAREHDVRLYGRKAVDDEFGPFLAGAPITTPLLVSGLRGVGKSAQINAALHRHPLAAAGLLTPSADPDMYLPGLWRYMLEELFETARGKGLVPAPARFPRVTPELAPGDGAEAFVRRFVAVAGAIREGTGAAGVVLVVDPVDTLFPIRDPIDIEADGGDGSDVVVQACVEIARQRAATVVFVTREIGAASTGLLGGRAGLLPSGCAELLIGLLPDDDCQDLFVSVAEDLGLDVSETAYEMLVAASGGHPQIAWQLASALSAQRARGSLAVHIDQVEQVLDAVLRTQEFDALARNLLADFSGPAQRILRALSQAPEGVANAGAVAASLPQLGGVEIVQAMLEELTLTTLVTPVTVADYQLRIGLLRRLLATEYPSL
jgi:hypothetical protein